MKKEVSKIISPWLLSFPSLEPHGGVSQVSANENLMGFLEGDVYNFVGVLQNCRLQQFLIC
jgi:hypothetical protein